MRRSTTSGSMPSSPRTITRPCGSLGRQPLATTSRRSARRSMAAGAFVIAGDRLARRLRALGRSHQPRRPPEGPLIARLRSHRSPAVGSARATRWWQGALLLVGAALFAFLIAEIGLAAIESSFRTLSWRLLIL